MRSTPPTASSTSLRFEIEEQCFSLIVTQQPAARDLRTIMTAMNIIVDLERMGDQTKGIAKVVPHLLKQPDAGAARQNSSRWAKWSAAC